MVSGSCDQVLEEVLIVSEDYPRMAMGNAMFAMFQRMSTSHGTVMVRRALAAGGVSVGGS